MAGVQWKKPQNMIDRTGGVVYRDRKDAKIALLAFGSRVLVLGWMFLSTRLYRKLDTSTSLQNFACIEDGRSVNAEPRPGPWGLDALAPWDTVYFLRIAKCGYEFDIFNAFFPLYPFLMRYIVAMLSFLKLDLISQMVPIETEYLVIGLLANLVAFCCAAVALHHLSLEVTRSHSLSNLAVIFFCFNPSSVFYSAAYTEALYAAFTWSGLVILHRNYLWGGTFVLAAATGVRSNGVLNCFFVAYKLFISRGQRHRKESQFSHSQWFPLFTKMLQFIGSCFIIVAPNLFMQVHGYLSYCILLNNVGGQRPAWCHKTMPSIYTYVQDVYWDVGFLRFYKHLQRWPWLLQSSPVLFIVIGSCWTWASYDWRRALSLGLICSDKKTKEESKHSRHHVPGSINIEAPFYNDELAPYIYHLFGMSLPAFLVMHVNVATRFLSSSPVLYWFAAFIFSNQSRLKSKRVVWSTQNLIWTWALTFLALGSLLFPNFYPWT